MIDRESFRQLMLREYGPMLGGMPLARSLGYSSLAALREAKKAGRLKVRVFQPPQLRGNYALTVEVADWLISAREQEEAPIA